jgi:hypothetical protein
MRLAKQFEAENPGWTVTYGVLGFTARCGDIEHGPSTAKGIQALIAAADNQIVRRIEQENPGWRVVHDSAGWLAAHRDVAEPVRGQTSQALQALLPYSGA